MRPWFLAIVANQCRQVQSKRRRSWIPMGRPASTADPSDTAVNRVYVSFALGRLSPQERLVLVLRYLLDLPFEEVGATAGMGTGAARVAALRAVRKLQAQVEREREKEVRDGSGKRS